MGWARGLRDGKLVFVARSEREAAAVFASHGSSVVIEMAPNSPLAGSDCCAGSAVKDELAAAAREMDRAWVRRQMTELYAANPLLKALMQNAENSPRLTDESPVHRLPARAFILPLDGRAPRV